MTKIWVALSAAALCLVTSACPVIDDLGAPCILVKADPTDTDPSDGTRSINIQESEISGYTDTDIISLGATECENLVCVRSANTADPMTPPTADAPGFCSRACAENTADGCLTGDPGVDNNDPYACRSLALDAETIAIIKETRPDLIPPGFTSPFFCASPLVPTPP
jgi:hypothetical protein